LHFSESERNEKSLSKHSVVELLLCYFEVEPPNTIESCQLPWKLAFSLSC